MSAYVVSGGSLFGLKCPASLDRGTEQQVSVVPLLGGKRKAFVRKGGRRSWSVSVAAASPSDVSTLESVARGVGPYGWYGPEAVAGNLLSPQASGFEVTPPNATGAGLVQLPDGTVAASVLHSGSGRVSIGGGEVVPLRPGTPITVGAWGLGGLRFWGTWRDSLGSSITAWSSGNMPFSGWQWREYTITPPAGAAGVDVELLFGTQYALPSVAWGTTGRPELGTGCPKAIIHSPQYSPLALWEGANYTGQSFSVVEVG